MRFKIVAIAALFMLILALGQLPTKTRASKPTASEGTAAQIHNLMATMNAGLEQMGDDRRVDSAAYITSADSGELGQIVFFNDHGNRQIGADWVPGDPRRGGFTDITYIIDQTEGAIDGLTTAQTNAAIDRAMNTWDDVKCSNIPITKLPNIPATDIGVVEFLSGLGGSPFVFADVTHAGWVPGGTFPPDVIAVTFTFVFYGPGGPTDIDNNGKADTAFAETLYHDAFAWAINGNIDVETVALHESGHSLSQGHDGALFLTLANGKFHFAPRAVMNAGYTGVQQSLRTTDIGGHCSIWASWPNN